MVNRISCKFDTTLNIILSLMYDTKIRNRYLRNCEGRVYTYLRPFHRRSRWPSQAVAHRIYCGRAVHVFHRWIFVRILNFRRPYENLARFRTGAGPRADGAERRVGDYFAIIAIFLYAAIYCFGVRTQKLLSLWFMNLTVSQYNSVPLTLISEIFTMRFRDLSMTFCLMWQWLCTL